MATEPPLIELDTPAKEGDASAVIASKVSLQISTDGQIESAEETHISNSPPRLNFCYTVAEDYPDRGRNHNHSKMGLIKTIMDSLSEDDRVLLRNSCFGSLVSLSERVAYSGQLIHFMLLRQVMTAKEKSMWFVINKTLLRFGLTEFSCVTGLKCTENEVYKGNDVDIMDVIGKPSCSVHELEGYFLQEPTTSPNKIKMALLLILEGILLARSKTLKVRQLGVNLLQDLDKFNNYSWGLEVFKITLGGLVKALQSQRTSGGYGLCGFPLAFQVWIFESIPALATPFAVIDKPNASPLFLRWRSIKSGNKMPTNKEIVKLSDEGLTGAKFYVCEAAELVDDQLRSFNEADKEDNNIDIFLAKRCAIISVVADAIAPGVQTKEDGGKRRRLPVPNVEDLESDDFVVDKKKVKVAPSCKHNKDNSNVEVPTSRGSEGGIKSTTVDPTIDKTMSEQMLSVMSSFVDKVVQSNKVVLQSAAGTIERLARLEDFVKQKFQNVEQKFDDHYELFDDVIAQQRALQAASGIMDIHLRQSTLRLDTLCTLLSVSHNPNEDGVCDGLKYNQHLTSLAQDDFSQSPSKEMLDVVHEITQAHSNKRLSELESTENTSAEDHPIPNKDKDGSNQELGVALRKGSRVRRPGPQEITPFKRLRDKRSTNVTIPKAPTQSFLTEYQRKKFYRWYHKEREQDDLIQLLTQQCNRRFFAPILEPAGMLLCEHIGEALCHIRKAMTAQPHMYSSVAVLDYWWTAQYNNTILQKFMQEGNNFKFDDDWFKYERGELPAQYGGNISIASKIYAPFQISIVHWVALEINLKDWTIYVYDSDMYVCKEQDLKEKLQPLCIMLPQFLKACTVHAVPGSYDQTLKVERRTDLPRSNISGSGGVYTVKYIDALCYSDADLQLMCDDYMPAYREQIAYDIFSLKWSCPRPKKK